MHPFLAYAQAKESSIIALIREFVECESPSDQPASLERFADLLAARAEHANVKKLPGGHARCEFALPGAGEDGRILALGHSDTVWPHGTLASMPFQEEHGRLWGPGVLDMKSGLAFFLYAVRLLRVLEVPVRRKIVLQVNADEEIGSPGSRVYTEEAARASCAVLVLEPGTGLQGKLKTARKGVGDYTIRIKGRAAHAGIDFKTGASAILELARQIQRVSKFTRLDQGITVNPGLIAGGTRSNVIAAEAEAEVDIRVERLKDAAALDKKFRALAPYDKRCSIEVEGGLNRPPMERSPGTAKLFQLARRCGKELGVGIQESASGGGSDGNFTAALGIPTLDGLGGVGEGAHATNESILVTRIADRVALLALLLSRI